LFKREKGSNENSATIKISILAFIAISLLLLVKEGESLLLSSSNIWLKLPTTLLFLVLIAIIIKRLDMPLSRLLGNPVIILSTMLAIFVTASVAAIFFQAHYFSEFGYNLSLAHKGVLLTASVLFGAFYLRWLLIHRNAGTGKERQRIHSGLVFGILALATVLRVVSIDAFPINAGRSDMLPLIIEAGKDFLSGQAPYHIYDLTSGLIPLTYLPGMWLPYMPLVSLGVDLRWLSVIAMFGIGLLVHLRFRGRLDPWVLILVGAVSLNPYLCLRHDVYAFFYWFLVFGFFVSFIAGRYYLSSSLLGLCIASQQPSLMFLPFYLVYLSRVVTRKELIGHLFALAIIPAAIILPFYLWAPQEFTYGVFGIWDKALNAKFESMVELLGTFNFSIFFYRVNVQGLLQPIQGLSVLVLAAWALRKVKSIESALACMILAYTAFMLLNPIVWTYLFIPMLLGLLALLMHRHYISYGVTQENKDTASFLHQDTISPLATHRLKSRQTR